MMSSKLGQKKPDRRTKRSQKRLFEALIALIIEKNYESISVSEIAERADVARATFYLHYDDKDALLLSSLDALMEDVTERVKAFSKQDLLSGVPHPSLIIFEYVQQDPELFRVILNGQGGSLMLQRFRFYMAQAAQQALESTGQQLEVPLGTVTDFVAGAMLSVLSGWLERGMTETPEEMASAFYQLVRSGFVSTLA